jgi:hypothetical protein
MIKLLIGKEVDLNTVEAYVTVYKPVAGFKAVLLSKDDECDGMHTPWQTGMWAFGKRIDALGDAIMWADAEDVPFYIADPTDEELAYINKFKEEQEAQTITINYTVTVVKSNGCELDYDATNYDGKLIVGQLLTLEGHSRPYFVKSIGDDGRYHIMPMLQEDEYTTVKEECFPCSKNTCHGCNEDENPF